MKGNAMHPSTYSELSNCQMDNVEQQESHMQVQL